MSLIKRKAKAAKEQAEREARRKACPIPFTEEEWFLWEEGDEEHHVSLIKKYLRTPEQKAKLDAFDITIVDCLNGNVEGADAREFVYQMFLDWDAKLGVKYFQRH